MIRIRFCSWCFAMSMAFSVAVAGSVEKKGGVPPVVHPRVGESLEIADGVSLTLVGKLQNYYGSGSDADILSPKSVNIHPSGKKFYVNSLEGGKTLVYSLPDLKKLEVITHSFSAKDSALWAPSSGLFIRPTVGFCLLAA